MRNRPGCQRHTSGRAGERGRGAGSAAQGWDQPGHRHPAPRHPAPHSPASPHPAPRDSAPATPRHACALPAGSPGAPPAPPHPGTSAPPTGCGLPPALLSALSPALGSARPAPAHARTRSRAAPATRPGAAAALSGPARRGRLCAEPPLLSPAPGNVEAKGRRRCPGPPSARPTSPRAAETQGQGGLQGNPAALRKRAPSHLIPPQAGLLTPHMMLSPPPPPPPYTGQGLSAPALPRSREEAGGGSRLPCPAALVFFPYCHRDIPGGTLPGAQACS